MSYFRNFPAIDYYFGNKTQPTRFQNMMVYADLIDQIKDDVSVYTEYNIQDGDRADQISQKLYGTTDYHWTLFLMNDDVRCHGFPLSYNDLVEKAKVDYPNTVLYTRNDMSTKFKVGTEVTGLTSGAKGTILRRRLDFGQMIISTTDTFVAGEIISATEADVLITATIDGVVLEYNAVHHYTNDSDLYVDVDPTAPYIQESEGKFVLFDSDYKLDTIYGSSALATANAGDSDVVRTVDVYRLIDRNLDVIETAPLGVVYFNDSNNYETYFNSAVSTTYSDSAAANTNLENLFDAYIVSNYEAIEPALLTPVTYLDRMTDANAAKQQIKVIKPDVIEDVINSFNSILLDAD